MECSPAPRESKTRIVSSFYAFYFQGYPCPDLSFDLRSRQNGCMDIDLRAMGQLESVVTDQDRQNSLKRPEVSCIAPEIRERGRSP